MTTGCEEIATEVGRGLTPNARVLLLARGDERIGALADGLDRLDWRTVTARSVEGALGALADLQVEAVIIDTYYGELAALSAAARLKAAYAPRRLPILALGAPHDVFEGGAWDLVIAPPAHAAQIALRLEALVRLAVAEEEFELRSKTFSERGRPLAPPLSDARRLQVLTVGEPSPKFLALSHALALSGAETTAAFTAYTAFDYLHDRAFDAVVLWAGETHAEALSIASGMRRNTRLYHIPTVLFQRTGADVGLVDAFNRGLTDVVSDETPALETARRVAALAQAFRRETALRRALDQAKTCGLMDPATGLFTRELFAAHLLQMAQALAPRRRPLSVAVLRINERSSLGLCGPKRVELALPQIGSMIGRLVRAEDTAARLGGDLFALALPAARETAAKAAAERIAAVIACTAFDGADGQSPFTVDFDVGAAEMGPKEHPSDTLERAAARAVG